MASFPTTLKNFISKLTGGVIEASHINDLQDEVSALETKVGVDGSAVTTSLDYLVKNTASVNPGHKHTLAGALNDVAITSPTDGQALAYNTATSKWENTTTPIGDASTAVKGVTKLSVAPVSASNPIAVGDNDGRVPTQSENDALVGTSGTAVSGTNKLVDNADTATSGANKVLRLDGTGKLPVLDGSQLTNIPSALLSKAKNVTANANGVTVSGLDLNTDEQYMVILRALHNTNGGSGAPVLLLRFNNDSGTNYDFVLQSYSNSGAGTRLDSVAGGHTQINLQGNVSDFTASYMGSFIITKGASNKAFVKQNLISRGAILQTTEGSGYYNGSANITSLNFSLSAASGTTKDWAVYVYRMSLV